MNNTNKASVGSQGDSPKAVPEVTRELVKDYLTRDLQCAINCLDAIYRDQDLLESMVDFMFGRFQNARHKEELKEAEASK